jgi:diguanylate cyclase (GGDEF)-like protein
MKITKDKIQLLKTITVLYVEDEEEIQQQLSLFLKARAGALYTAFNGKDGLEAYMKYKPDIVITDIRMPTMDGLELAKAIRKIDRDIPIIITTAFNDQEFFLKSIETGIDRYILKPTDPYLLLDALIKSVMVLIQKREIELNNKYIRFIFDANPNFMITTSKCELEYINKTFLNFLGYRSVEDFKKDKKSLEDFFLKIDGIPCSGKEKQNWMQYIINNPDRDVLVYFNNRQNPEGDLETYLATCNRFPELDKYIFSFTDITKIEKEKKALEKQAITDILTGVFNRKKLIDSLHAEINRTRRYKTPLSVIMFDIDHFKNINDLYGHDTGDDVLKEIVGIVSENIRENDILVRWGGEEFLILAPETNIYHARLLADKLRLMIKGFEFARVGNISGSFGVTQFREDDDMDSFIKRVDVSLYKAKKGGRDKVEA